MNKEGSRFILWGSGVFMGMAFISVLIDPFAAGLGVVLSVAAIVFWRKFE